MRLDPLLMYTCSGNVPNMGSAHGERNEYVAFIMSRLFSGFGGTVPSVIGNQIITDLFFIHERGRAFSISHLSFLFGPVGIPIISGFISAHVSWTVMYWWTLGLLGLTLICIFFFMEETEFSRGETNYYHRVQNPLLQTVLQHFSLATRSYPQLLFPTL